MTENSYKPKNKSPLRGRPRYSRNTNKVIEDLLNERIQVRENGKITILTAREILAKNAVLKAAKGDPSALNFILNQIPTSELAEEFILLFDPEDLGVL